MKEISVCLSTNERRSANLQMNNVFAMNFFFYNPNDVPQEIKDNKIQKDIYCSTFNLNVKNIDNEPYDYYIIPIIFRTTQLEQDPSHKNLNKYIESLCYFKQYPEKHVFILQSDYNPLKAWSDHGSKIFCDSCCKSDANIYPLPFFVHYLDKSKSIERLGEKPISEAEFDISFQGCVLPYISNIRPNMLEKVKLINKYKIFLEEKNRYFWSYKFTAEEILYERTKYINNIVKSKFVLCPRGVGYNSSRFFETIWFGRIPILISDEVKLPLEFIIPWNDLIVKVSETDMNIEEKITEFLNKHNLEEVSQKLKTLARKYFDRNFLPQLIKTELSLTLDTTNF